MGSSGHVGKRPRASCLPRRGFGVRLTLLAGLAGAGMVAGAFVADRGWSSRVERQPFEDAGVVLFQRWICYRETSDSDSNYVNGGPGDANPRVCLLDHLPVGACNGVC